MHRTNLYLPIPLFKQLKARAKKEGLTLSEIVRRSLAADFAEEASRIAQFAAAKPTTKETA